VRTLISAWVKRSHRFSRPTSRRSGRCLFRAIIIDRGKIVANGKPAELRRKSDWLGPYARFANTTNGIVKQNFPNSCWPKRSLVLEEKASGVTCASIPKLPAATG